MMNLPLSLEIIWLSVYNIICYVSEKNSTYRDAVNVYNLKPVKVLNRITSVDNGIER